MLLKEDIFWLQLYKQHFASATGDNGKDDDEDEDDEDPLMGAKRQV